MRTETGDDEWTGKAEVTSRRQKLVMMNGPGRWKSQVEDRNW